MFDISRVIREEVTVGIVCIHVCVYIETFAGLIVLSFVGHVR